MTRHKSLLTFFCGSLEQRTAQLSVTAFEPRVSRLWRSTIEIDKRTSTLSQRQFPQGAPSTTSHRTLRARHDTQARAARRFVIFSGCSESPDGEERFLLFFSGAVFDVDVGDDGAAAPCDASVVMAILAVM